MYSEPVYSTVDSTSTAVETGQQYSIILPIQLIPFRKLGIQVHPPNKRKRPVDSSRPAYPTRPGCLIESRLAIAFVWFHCLSLVVVCSLLFGRQVAAAEVTTSVLFFLLRNSELLRSSLICSKRIVSFRVSV